MRTEQQQQVAEQILSAVQQRLSTTEIDVRIVDVVKNNSVEMTSISAGRDGLACNLYIDSHIDQIINGNATLDDVANAVSSTLKRQAEQSPFTASGVREIFEHPDTSRIMLKVVNREHNEDMLKNTPHQDIHGDLSLVAVYKVSEDATAVITNGLSVQMGMTAAELLDYATKNTKAQSHTVKSMGEMLAEQMGLSHDEANMMFGTDDTMIVVTNADKHYGAVDIFIDAELRKQVVEKLNADFYILPSSIHEVICVRADTLSPEQATMMISEINANELEAVDVLSSHPYLVNAQTLTICNPCESLSEQVADEMKHSIHL